MRSSMSSMMVRGFGLLILAFPILAGSSDALQAKQEPTKGKQTVTSQAAPTPSTTAAINIKVETFRKQTVAGAPLGVVADITNNSSASVYLREQDVQLLLPPEVERPGLGAYSSDGWFPTEYLEKDHVISLKPKESYRVFWNRSAEVTPDAAGSTQSSPSTVPAKESTFSSLRKWFQFISFAPGTYPITVEAKYWDRRMFDGDDYHTVVETKTIEWAAPQRIVLLGAILGGLIFTVLSMVRAEQTAVTDASTKGLGAAKSLAKIGLTLLGSVLLSVIITVLLSRIEETQFFIKVSVSDFWGAIAVGFLANYGGWTLLDKMVPATRVPGGEKKQDQARGAGEEQKPAQAKGATAGTP